MTDEPLPQLDYRVTSRRPPWADLPPAARTPAARRRPRPPRTRTRPRRGQPRCLV